MYKLKLTRREKTKLLRIKWVIILFALVGLGLIIWLVWIRPIQTGAQIRTFDERVKAGNPIQESYPEVCLTKDGKRFTNPKQQQAHQKSLDGTEELTPPTNPAQLVLDIKEWGVRVPLTQKTFDLGYLYLENGGEEYILFTYKRLSRAEVCKGDIGLRLTRSIVEHKAPFTAARPAPMAQVDKYFYYVTYAEKPCHDATKAEQVALVKEIADGQSLTLATTGLLTKLFAIPKTN